MNKYFVSGNIGQDAEQKTIAGHCYASFSIAVTEKVKGEDKTMWVRVMKIDQEGKLTPYLTKGKRICVIGKPVFNAYKNKSGEAAIDVTVWANELEFFGSNKENEQKQTPSGINNFPPQSADDDNLPF